MGYEISYNSYTDKDAKHCDALRDFKQYNKRAYDTLFHVLMTQEGTYRQYSFYAGIAGIQGYPVVALWNEVHDAARDMSM